MNRINTHKKTHTFFRKERGKRTRGFTLIELMVAVSLFTVVMTVSVGALLSIINANKKAQALQSVMNNLNVAIGGMVRNIRMGSDYHCGAGSLQVAQDCVGGGTSIGFVPFGTNPASTMRTSYWISQGQLFRKENNQTLPITSPYVQINTFKVYVTGAARTLANGDINQPKVLLMIQGEVGVPGTAGLTGSQKSVRAAFNIEAVASQRRLDI